MEKRPLPPSLGDEELPLYRGKQEALRKRRGNLGIAFVTLAIALFIWRDSLLYLCHPLHSRLGSRRIEVPSGTRNKAYIVEATSGAVASENEICSEVGVDILRVGGNAVDAIVSTTLCIGVVNMFS